MHAHTPTHVYIHFSIHVFVRRVNVTSAHACTHVHMLTPTPTYIQYVHASMHSYSQIRLVLIYYLAHQERAETGVAQMPELTLEDACELLNGSEFQSVCDVLAGMDEDFWEDEKEKTEFVTARAKLQKQGQSEVCICARVCTCI